MKNKKVGIISGGVLVLALVAMIGIVYAAYSQTLNINGDATVKANSWNIHFANLSDVELKGEAKEITKPTIKNNSTTIGDYSVLLSKPGDSIKYTFDVVNDGTFNAMLDVLKIPTPTCTGTGETAEEDAAKVCKHLEYRVSNEQFEVSVGGYIEHFMEEGGKLDREIYEAFGLTTVLYSKDEVDIPANLLGSIYDGGLYLELTYDRNVPAEDLPKNDVAISNLGVELIFTQVD